MAAGARPNVGLAPDAGLQIGPRGGIVVDAHMTILDVRTPAEYEAWHIPGAVLLPYTELRHRLDEVPGDKPAPGALEHI